VAIGAEATFVARAIDTDKQGMADVLRAAAAHKGAAFVEILQNCNIYNDGAWDVVRDDKENRLYLREGEEIRWGDRGVRMRPDGTLEVVAADAGGLLRHDPRREDPGLSFALARLTWKTAGCVPLGIFRDVARPVYDEDVRAQVAEARERKGVGDLAALVAGGDTWVIEG
jgi:2-oxoglutarate ferredoxin oxidoreductase subunit beta